MHYYVYMLKTLPGYKSKTYVGYSTDLAVRLRKHNSNKGAKATKGYKWDIIYKKKFLTKSEAMSYEYKLKNNISLRKKILIKSSL